ncbi:DUF418 domain-containing protein [Kineococcus terrestris]|uniref:DUF418 domain-containing protein n=1 Tax=Kineococcus terrestris TaxID=2044856 RepID=UPI0034DB1E95
MTTSSAPSAPPLRGTPLADRALAPDLARGALLLLICLANVHVYLHARQQGIRAYPAADLMTLPDRVVTAVQLSLVDGRAFPMFGLLVGFGAHQLAVRRLRRGVPAPDVRRLLRRRGLALLLVGGLHGVLLFSGDIAAAYGVLLLLLAPLVVGAGRRALRALAAAGLVLAALAGLGEGLPMPEGATSLLPSTAEESVLTAALFRAGEWLAVGVLVQVPVVGGMVALGVLVGRRGWLDDPVRHRPLLARLAAGGLLVAALGGLPLGLAAAGVFEPTLGQAVAAGALHSATGFAGGLGYACLAALVAASLSARGASPAPVRWLTALGRRSLTGYLAHSVVFAGLLTAWAGGLGAILGVAQAALLAVGTWLLLVAGAVALEAAGRRGPAETWLRRLTYGRGS